MVKLLNFNNMKRKAYINILKEWNKDELFVQATLFNSKK